MKIFRLLLCLIATTFFEGAKAQPYYFKHYEVEHGLSNNTVLCSVQDRKGFMWFGTIDGLNRFDGYTFKTFRKDPADSNSLGNNSVYSLCQGVDENLWVGTAKGLYKYNLVDQSFELIPSTSDQRVRSMFIDDKGELWFTLNRSFASYNDKTKTLRP